MRAFLPSKVGAFRMDSDKETSSFGAKVKDVRLVAGPKFSSTLSLKPTDPSAGRKYSPSDAHLHTGNELYSYGFDLFVRETWESALPSSSKPRREK